MRARFTAHTLTAGTLALLGWGVVTTVAQTGTTAPATPGAPAVEPPIPATTTAKSPFAADRPSSEPLGLAPNQTTDPFSYPAEPVVLHWSPVPGAVSYLVEIATNPGFTQVVWKTDTDRWQAAPDIVLPDATYWWRVTATDAAGTKGITSEAAQFAKNWPAEVTGGVLSATPGGASSSLIRTTPYMRWNAVPGARSYDTQIAAADQFASPAFSSTNFPVLGMSPAETGVLTDDVYQWRVRATDPKGNPGPWTTVGSFTKAWVAPDLILPADNATSPDLYFSWSPVTGAEKYQIQITREQHNWQGDSLELDATTTGTGFTPTLDEVRSKSMGYGNHWWRVRPVVSGTYGTWTEARKLTWAAPSTTTTGATLVDGGNSDSALSPHLRSSHPTGASIYRFDIATDAQFNNVVESAITVTPSWIPRTPLKDNQVGQGYYWRMLWGSGTTSSNPHWMESETVVPRLSFTKQTRVVLGTAASGVVSEPPLFTWSDVSGAPRYELQLSRDTEFASDRTQSMKVWGTGTEWSKDKGKRLASGTWFWRVRGLDGAGQEQTWSANQTFTLNPPRPTVTAPADDAVVVGAPLMQWDTVNSACAYQVQLSQSPSFPETPGATELSGVISTQQTAVVPSSALVTATGTWYWRVRADFCDKDYGPWSPTRNFRSVKPPQFNLNRLPNTVPYGRPITVAGRLMHNGAAVRTPTLLVERRTGTSGDYKAYGTVNGDAAGRFSFSLPQRATAAWRVRWEATSSHPEGVAPFALRVVPRVSMRLGAARVERKRWVTVRGSVFPRRPALVQVRESTGWATLAQIPGTSPRFTVRVKAAMNPGKQQVRLFVPAATDGSLAATGSTRRHLLVFDRFVIR